MKVKIYDYDDKAKEIKIPDDKQIKSIDVRICSGDETGYINFTDDTSIMFDASCTRCMLFDDGCYNVEGDDIQKWLNWTPTHGEYLLPYSYMRQMAFSGL